MILDYEKLKADFNQKLVTQLRGHSADNQYLETWVPDEDPVKSILNMVEAALSSGLDAMRVRVASETLSGAQRDALLAELATIAKARLVGESSGFELIVESLESGQILDVVIHPALEGAAIDAAKTVVCEGDLLPDLSREPIYRAIEAGVTLAVRLDTSGGRPRVAAARHSGAQETALRGILDIFCRVIEALPLQEAADHGAIHALELLRSGNSSNPVPGVLTPRSAGKAFTSCERLIRDILKQHQLDTGKFDTRNFWNPPLSSAWRAATDEQRIATLLPKLAEFRAAHRLSESDMWVAAIERTRRVIISFGPEVVYDRKPGLLMELELEVRKSTGDRLEFFMDEKIDINKTRRLGPGEENA